MTKKGRKHQQWNVMIPILCSGDSVQSTLLTDVVRSILRKATAYHALYDYCYTQHNASNARNATPLRTCLTQLMQAKQENTQAGIRNERKTNTQQTQRTRLT